MTKLYIRYSYVYEETLARLSGEGFSYADFEKTQKFTEEFGKFWEQYNDAIFEYYKGLGLILPEFWIAYAVNSRKGVTPFSDPLTFFVSEDFETTTTILIHELCHVFLTTSDNMKISNELWEETLKKYPNENFNTLSHLLVNLLAKGGVEAVFGKEKAKKLMEQERNLIGLKEAWAIIDTKPEVLVENNPIKAIRML